jgi:hypothetical protein
MANFLWVNQGEGRFRNTALLAGAAVDLHGKPQASMGVDAGDFDGDGDLDLFMTHLTDEVNTLYRNDGKGLFVDVSFESGAGPPSRSFTGFGTAWFDYDNDGWLDLFVANGAVRISMAQAGPGDRYPLRQHNQLLHNRGGGVLEAVEGGLAPDVAEVSRGAALGDVDNDGDLDVLVTNSNGPLRLMINQLGHRRQWTGLRLLEAPGGRDALGAMVAVELASGRVLWRRVRIDGSYASSNDPRVLIGLGDAERVAGVLVVWADGSRERFAPDAVGSGRYVTLVRGTGRGER